MRIDELHSMNPEQNRLKTKVLYQVIFHSITKDDKSISLSVVFHYQIDSTFYLNYKLIAIDSGINFCR